MKLNKIDLSTLKIKIKNINTNNFLELETSIILKLKSGRTIALPDKFEILTIKNGNITSEKIKNLKTRDLIAIPRKLPNDNHYQKLDNMTPLETRMSIIPKLPSILNEDLSYFLGLISSDGYIRRDNKIVLINKNKKVINSFKKLVKTLFGLKVGKIPWEERRNGKIYKWVYSLIYSKALKEYIIINFELREGKKDNYIRVPQIIFNSPKSVIARYLQGLFDGDGSMVIGQNNVTLKLAAKNRDFAYDIQELLLLFGIRAHVNESKRKLWNVNITNRVNIEKFKNEIGFIHPIRSKNIHKATAKKECKFIKIGKIIKKERIKQEISLKGLSKKLGIGATTIDHYERDDCLPKIEILKKLAAILSSEKLLKIAKSKEYLKSIRERHKLSGFRKVTSDDALPEDFARKCILEIKERYNVSQEDIAKSIGTSQGRIGNYERGDTRISYEVIKKLNKKFPTPFISLIANSDVFFDKVVDITQSTSKITWPKINDFIYHNKIIARCS